MQCQFMYCNVLTAFHIEVETSNLDMETSTTKVWVALKETVR